MRYQLRITPDHGPDDAIPLDPQRVAWTIGRGDDADVVLTHPSVSRKHCRIESSAAGLVIVDLKSRHGTCCAGEPVISPLPLNAGDALRIGTVCAVLEALRDDADATLTAAALPPGGLAADATRVDRPDIAPNRRTLRGAIALGDKPLTIGRDAACDIRLDCPLLSRRHAEIVRHGRICTVRDLASGNGTFVNQERITAPRELRPDDLLRLGSFELRFDGAALVSSGAEDGLHLEARGLRVRTRGPAGAALALLNDVSFTVRPREFVGILGLSGCGKSTLMNTLNGRRPADAGSVCFNGVDLDANIAALGRSIGYVPQKLILHEELSVCDALRYACRLRLPPDVSVTEIEANIDRVLGLVGLQERRETCIARLSGGQQKRVAIAMELLSRPTVLLLDEATSGLDQATEAQMMALFRKLADTGVTTLCITHYADSLEQCDMVLHLMQGRVAFYGPPRALKRHYGVASVRDVLLREAEKSADERVREFHSSPNYQRYIIARRSGTAESPQSTPSGAPRAAAPRLAAAASQFGVLTRRYARLLLCQRMTLAVSLGLAPLIALLVGISLAPPDHLDALVERIRHGHADREHVIDVACETRRQLLLGFVSVTAMFFLGFFCAIREIVREQAIRVHERFHGVSNTAYLGSKIVPLAALVLVQAVALKLASDGIAAPQLASGFGAQLGHMLLLIITGWTAMLLGLAISAAVRSQETAVAVMIAALIPQILFADALQPLSGFARAIGEHFVVSRAALQGMQALTWDELRMFERPSAGASAWSLLCFGLSYALLALVFLALESRRATVAIRSLARRAVSREGVSHAAEIARCYSLRLVAAARAAWRELGGPSTAGVVRRRSDEPTRGPAPVSRRD